jgi:hypothetical protein
VGIGRQKHSRPRTVFLDSDASACITAQTLLVGGGISTGATRALSKKRA